MNNHHHPAHDMYYEQPSSRSPGAHRHQQQTLHRQSSRQFDVYGPMPNNNFTPDDHTMRYDGNRFDRMNAPMQGGGYGYDLSGNQTWNPNAFSGGTSFSSFGATGRIKPMPRGRSALPPVCRFLTPPGRERLLTGTSHARLGLTSSSSCIQAMDMAVWALRL